MKGGQFIWGEEQQNALEEIKGDYKNHQYYICLIKAFLFIFRY